MRSLLFPVALAASFLWLTLLWVTSASGQDGNAPAKPTGGGVRLGKSTMQRWQIGLAIKANGACSGIYATTPIPVDWPEQKVELVSEEISPANATVTYRTLEGGVKQLLFRVPRLAAGEEAQALLTFDVTKHEILPPESTADFVAPEKTPKEALKFLAPSPSIESSHVKIKSLAKDLLASKADATAWARVEALYDGARAKLEYRHDLEFRSTLAALERGVGDCEELSALFVALCRASKIPARCVWVNSHTYPEFYLQDQSGAGHWFPCQAAGEREFGGIRDQQPILQKGDSFKVPEFKQPQRYVQVFCKVEDVRGGQPQVMEVRKVLPAK